MTKKTLSIAAVQHRSEPGARDENLDSAAQYITQAARRDAELVVLPELFATGYAANEHIFAFGEPEDGSTLFWLREQAKLHRLFLGGGVPVFENGHLYNRFYLCDPSGEICGYAQKQYGEAYCFKRGVGRFRIDTPLGRIGVSICADSHFSTVIAALQDLDIDILLMPHAWATMQTGSQDEWEFASTAARLLNVPTVFVNGVGKMEPMQGLLGKLMPPEKFQLRGRSCILDANGVQLAALNHEPGVLVKEVALGRTSNHKPAIPDYDGWIHPGSSLLRNFIIPLDIWRGKRVYEVNRVKHR